MSNDSLIDAFVNPLAFFAFDEPWAARTPHPPTATDFLNFLCTPGTPSDIGSLKARYGEISQEPERLFVAPGDQRILEKLVWPLRHAKASYMVGDFLTTIMLCGTVAEMIALFIYEISSLEGNTIRDKAGNTVTSEAFERERQGDRVKLLVQNKVIDAAAKARFDLVRKTRRKYLHLWSQDHDSLQQDALLIFPATVSLVVNAFGLSVDQGKLVLKPGILKYLQKTGHISLEDNADQTPV